MLSSDPDRTILEQYFDAWNARDMEAALACFVDNCRYETEDPVFVTKLRGKEELRRHLTNNARSLPSNCQIVLDDWAMDRMAVGATWHLEVGGLAVPNLQGCSMYTLDESDGIRCDRSTRETCAAILTKSSSTMGVATIVGVVANQWIMVVCVK